MKEKEQKKEYKLILQSRIKEPTKYDIYKTPYIEESHYWDDVFTIENLTAEEFIDLMRLLWSFREKQSTNPS